MHVMETFFTDVKVLHSGDTDLFISHKAILRLRDGEVSRAYRWFVINHSDLHKIALLIELGDTGTNREYVQFLSDTCSDEAVRRLAQGAIDKTPQKQSRKPKKERIPGRLRKQVFERDAYRCQACDGWESLTVDHIIPESKGGTLAMDNLQTLCKSCNSKKGAKTQ